MGHLSGISGIGTDHLLVGMASVANASASRALRSVGVTAEGLEEKLISCRERRPQRFPRFFWDVFSDAAVALLSFNSKMSQNCEKKVQPTREAAASRTSSFTTLGFWSSFLSSSSIRWCSERLEHILIFNDLHLINDNGRFASATWNLFQACWDGCLCKMELECSEQNT